MSECPHVFADGGLIRWETTTKAAVKKYITHEVQTVSPTDMAVDVIQRIAESDGHNGFLVCDGRKAEGFVTARDISLSAGDAPIETVMATDLIVAHPEVDVNNAARVILRSGIQKLPVVDDAGNLVGIILSTGVIRSQIERATPEKVGRLMRTLEQIHGITVHQERRMASLSNLIPTQARVYADELNGRRYELERGLVEPLVVIDNSGMLSLADGHHRVFAADRIGIGEMDAYVIVVGDPVELGMQQTAEKEGLSPTSDIDIADYARHPLVETTRQLQ